MRNFSAGQLVDTKIEPLRMGRGLPSTTEYRAGVGNRRTPVCRAVSSNAGNVYADADGNEVVSPLEYETIGLLGSNCGLSDPDELARLNAIANDLGIDSIETGAMLAVWLMEAGLAEFGDVDFMTRALEEIRQGSAKGRLWAQGTARVGEHYKVKRVPVIKQQAISAYDPRVIEVTGHFDDAHGTGGRPHGRQCADDGLQG